MMNPNAVARNYLRYLPSGAWKRSCPSCDAPAGIVCRTNTGKGNDTPHVARTVV